MADAQMTATVRKEFGKGAARRLRRTEQVPGVIYGHGGETKHVALPSYDLMMALKTPNALIALDIDGKQELVIPKAIQREAIRGFLVHIDLLLVKKGEQVNVDIPVQTEGTLAPGQNLLETMLDSVPVVTEATKIPDYLVASIEGLAAGDVVLAKDIPMPTGTSLNIEGDAVVFQVLGPQAEEPTEDEDEAAE